MSLEQWINELDTNSEINKAFEIAPWIHAEINNGITAYDKHVKEGSCLDHPGKREVTIIEHLKRSVFAKFGEHANDLANEKNVRYFRTNLDKLEPIELPESIPTENFSSEHLFNMGFALIGKKKNAPIIQKKKKKRTKKKK